MSSANGQLPDSASPPTSAQPFLFSEQTIAELTNAEKQGKYTLSRLRELRPEAIEEIIHLRGEFVGKLRIAEIVHVHHETVTAVDAAYAERIDISRTARVARLRSAADKQVELMDQNPDRVPWNVRHVAASQLYNTAELLDGKITSRVEHQMKHVDIYSDWPAFVESTLREAEAEWGAKATPQEKQVWAGVVDKMYPPPDEVLDVGAVTGLAAKNLPAIEDESVCESGGHE